MKRLLHYLSNYKLESILGPLFKMLEASFELFVPLVVASMIDKGIKHQDVAYILRMGGILILLGIIGLACSLTAQYFAAKTAVSTASCLRNDLFFHISHLSYPEIDGVGTSTLITRMTSDINQVQTGINMVLRLFLRSPLWCLAPWLWLSPWMLRRPWPLWWLSPCFRGGIRHFADQYAPLQKGTEAAGSSDADHQGNLFGVRVIRAFNRQKSETARFEEENGLLVRFQVFVGKISALLNPITYIMINFATIAVIWIGAKQVDGGMITQGKVVALVNYMSQILVELIKLANLIITISKSIACMNRVDSVFKLEPSIREKAGASGTGEAFPGEAGAAVPKVEFRQVSALYAGAKEEALSDICFSAGKGETIGIIGGTGSGKSTLVNLIPRFYDIASGSLLVNGVEVKDYSLGRLREAIGVVPQKAVLFQGSLRENMRWGKEDASDEEIYRALDIAQAREFVEQKGKGLDLMIEQGGRNLSGGQKQRLTIARALVKNPEILILDDSASALDFATDAKLRKAIKENTQDMTVFLVSQRAATIKNADQILVLDDGKLAGKGTHKELLNQCELYREICLSQFSREEVERDGR